MDWFFQQLPNLSPDFGHVMVTVALLVLLLSGFGLPVPEDIPLIVVGYACYNSEGSDQTMNVWFMLPLAFLAVIGADCTLYYLGRRYGHHVPRLPLLRKYLTEPRLARAELAFHKHGGKTLFIARFLPGLRAPVFLTAGVFKIPFWKMLAFDGTAAALSVPAWVLAAYYLGENIDRLKVLTRDAKMVIGLTAMALVVAYVVWRLVRRRRMESPG